MDCRFAAGFFQFVFGTGEKKLKNEKAALRSNGMEVKMHGHVKNQIRALNAVTYEYATKFIKNFGEQQALVLPGRLPTYRLNTDLLILPCSMTKAYVYNEYVAACKTMNIVPVHRSTWYELWNERCANVVIQKPKNDLCTVCQKNVMSLVKLRGLPVAAKEKVLQDSMQHLEKVKEERAFYNQVISDCMLNFATRPPSDSILRPRSPCSLPLEMHISFDFAQQVGIPYSSQQVGPIYFLSAFKIGLFGVGLAPLKKFVLYVIPESCDTGKGANTVISLIHHFIENFGVGEVMLQCHADNCTAQNKNNIVMKYFAWRIVKKLHQRIRLHFLPVGHTKFYPDIIYGLIKRAFRRSDCYSVRDFVRIITRALPKLVIVCHVGTERGTVYVPTFDWQKYFTKTPNVPQLLSFSHSEFSEEHPGVVRCSKAVQPDETAVMTEILPAAFDVSEFPLVVRPKKLTQTRRDYLMQNLGPYVPGKKRNYFLWKKRELVKKRRSRRATVSKGSTTGNSALQTSSAATSSTAASVAPRRTTVAKRSTAENSAPKTSSAAAKSSTAASVAPPTAGKSARSRTKTRTLSRSEF